MLGIRPDSQSFSKDQRPISILRYWNTPMTALAGGIASEGLLFSVREPDFDGLWTMQDVLKQGGAIGTTEWESAGRYVARNGRWSNAIGFWAGGTPGFWGGSIPRRIGLRFTGTFKPEAQRAWFATGSPSVQFAVAGSGYCRIQHNTNVIFGGATLDAAGGTQRGTLSENRFLAEGLAFTPPVTLQTGDTLDIFYAQNDEVWGGLVVKVYNPARGQYGIVTDASSVKHRRDAAATAVVVGCGVFEHAAVTGSAIPMIGDIDITLAPTLAQKLEFTVPLTNTAVTDFVGWVWDTTNNPTGQLIATDVDGNQVTLRRGRLVQCELGFADHVSGTEMWRVFTGLIDDFENPSTGKVTVRCLGFEERLARAHVKNFPDSISYMSYDFHKVGAKTVPSYGVLAYDNWPIELALRDLLVRSGIDESRLAAPLLVPQADGSMDPVEM